MKEEMKPEFMTNLHPIMEGAVQRTLEAMKDDPDVLGYGVFLKIGEDAGPGGSTLALWIKHPEYQGDLSGFWKRVSFEPLQLCDAGKR